MVQKEVAERLTARPGERASGAITYMVDYYATAQPIIKVDKSSFIPSPKVDSEVIKLEIRSHPMVQVEDEKAFFALIQKSFTQRRKTLANVLVNYNYVKDKSEALKLLRNKGLNENVRGESLTLEQFTKILD